MYTRAQDCPVREGCLHHGSGITKITDLATREQMYNTARLFARITLEPGCKIGYHLHENEVEFYYILQGEAVLVDNGQEVILYPGDVSATASGESHSLENRGTETVELMALVVLQ
ncbi:cupin domain-containing protein [Dysosmobacter sp.]|uniref:cupin domain-containing protein n=1 Tax=Dysosmobacter sp. TaxID=2591382 RepID=UPI002A8589AC|nr:cupin domain-containing protein [Dysosmobacter sp.]MDY3281385.1 cupin domain-containing protein [Dysosmobacter sp.]